MSIDQTQPYTILQLLSEDVNYQIPVYQRNYAWEQPQISALIQDVYDYYVKSKEKMENYYIGSLVVAQKDHYFEVLDGQQRFTTLNLIVLFLKSKLNHPKISQLTRTRLSFESREKSIILLNSLWKYASVDNLSFEKELTRLNVEYADHSILKGYRIIAQECLRIVREEELEQFADYLFDRVVILRTKIPELADVTHYFDALNNRGEQLEAHEVIKAHFLSLLSTDEDDRNTVHQVWSACQDMYKYVAYGFNTDQRKHIFGDAYHGWLVQSYGELKQYLCIKNTVENTSSEGKSSYGDKLALDDILKLNPVPISQKLYEEESSERFTSIIDYPNFLMQVLKIYIKKQSKEGESSKVLLDDKTLLESFKNIIIHPEHVKSFIYLLLKTRYLFDLYVIKRENSQQYKGWSLKKPKCYFAGNVSYVNTFSKADQSGDNELALGGSQRNLVMLLSAFHVSYPTHARKNWLFSVLYWLTSHSQQDISLDSYVIYLEDLARNLIKKRYLSALAQDYESFMYSEQFDYDTTVTAQDVEAYFTYKRIRSFCLNYLDYILLKNKLGKHSEFYFSYKDSIEHFYPQNPKVGERLPSEILNCFGNLGLVNQSENSTLTNDMPIQKANWLRRHTKVPISLKLELMMQAVDKNESEWNKESIEKHQHEMVKLLLKDLNEKVCS
ncbi:hypothetical protein GCM10027155_02860 [Acinetobacter apis]|uniref:DUF262 domain-containing protein n=1 Tax=Acinetobacter apis TaxID=1229165 RepID=A0A217EDN7_9GAMM|nr:DUF262 domain-containing protein [Acinetobacter apis]SNQ28372.1 Protein of unknown function [Acinetobacter apis]